jgi:hypothetical protein
MPPGRKPLQVEPGFLGDRGHLDLDEHAVTVCLDARCHAVARRGQRVARRLEGLRVAATRDELVPSVSLRPNGSLPKCLVVEWGRRGAGAGLVGPVVLVIGAAIFALDHAAPFGPTGMVLWLVGAVMIDHRQARQSAEVGPPC